MTENHRGLNVDVSLIEQRKAEGAQLVRNPARPDLRGVRETRGRGPCPALSGRCRPLRAHAVGAHRPHRRQGRRRGDVRDARTPVREGRRALLDRTRRIRARIPRANSWRRRRSPLLGLRHLADRAHAQPARAGRAHEHALRRHHQGVVRRRRRPDAGARPPPHPGGRRHARLPCRDEGGLLRAERRCRLRQVQEMVRRVFLPAAPQRSARHRRHLLRLA